MSGFTSTSTSGVHRAHIRRTSSMSGFRTSRGSRQMSGRTSREPASLRVRTSESTSGRKKDKSTGDGPGAKKKVMAKKWPAVPTSQKKAYIVFFFAPSLKQGPYWPPSLATWSKKISFLGEKKTKTRPNWHQTLARLGRCEWTWFYKNEKNNRRPLDAPTSTLKNPKHRWPALTKNIDIDVHTC